MRGRAFAPTLALAGLGLAAALVIGELAARTLPPLARRVAAVRAAPTHREDVHPRGLYRMDGEACWTLTPGFVGRYVRPAFDIEVRANRLGLRGGEPGPRAPGTFRVLGLGDSFAFGWGVSAEACFLKRLEALLDASRPGRRHEVLNAGIPGYGTFEARRRLDSVLPEWPPDLVILAFYEGNDYLNNGDAPRRRTVTDGYLTDLDGRGGGFLLRHSAFAALAVDQWAAFSEKRSFRTAVGKTKGLLLEMQRTLAARGVPFVVVFIPDQDPAAYSRPALLRLTDRLQRGEDVFRQRGELASFCQDEGIGFCRLSPRFESDPGASALRISAEDTHFNTEGHRRAAEEIHAWLEAHPRVLEGKVPRGP
jgi:lysophospholipase L1-like esterase